MLKQYIDKYTIKDVPQNGTIIVEIIDKNNKKIQQEAAISNLPIYLKNNSKIAKLNNFYEYKEISQPEGYEDFIYELEDDIIYKIWVIAPDIEEE